MQINLKTIHMKKMTMLLILAAALLQGVTLQAQERPWMKYITPSGYFQTGFQINDSFDNSFYIKRARISLSGAVYESERFGKLEYKVQAELAGSPKLVTLPSARALRAMRSICSRVNLPSAESPTGFFIPPQTDSASARIFLPWRWWR